MQKRIPLAISLFLVLLIAVPAQANPWTTSGGTPERAGLVTEALGFLDIEKRIELPFGQSASQPIQVGDRIYHLAGEGLWELSLKAGDHDWEATFRRVVKSNLHPDTHQVKVSSSTPTYSPESGWIYWGTAHGFVWGYHPATGRVAKKLLDIGCSIVSSPLVMRLDGQDVVIVGQKPVDGVCDQPGKIFAIWGWDRPEEPEKTETITKGWATPSPVPDTTDPTMFIAGADGVDCESGNGLAAKYQVKKQQGGAYSLIQRPWGPTNPCLPSGVAGSFATSHGAAFWLDTAGRLYARRLSDGKPLPGWQSESINLPAAIGGTDARAFTNTKPALHVTGAGPDGTLQGTAVVTLRNYTGPGGLTGSDRLRGCPDGSRFAGAGGYECPGAPGALAAVDLATGQVTPYHQPTQAQFDVWRAANTDPLILTGPDTLLFGDATGTVWGRPLTPGPGDTAAAITHGFQEQLSLLHPGEEPMRGSESWSQVSGAGVDPVVISGPAGTHWLLMGVNTMPPPGEEAKAWQHGRLTLIPFGPTFNLKWADALTTQPAAPWAPGVEVTVSGTVTLEETSQTLAQLRPAGVRVTWFLIPEGWTGVSGQVFRLGSSEPLPPTMQAGQSVAVQQRFQVTERHPEKGRIIGVIDAETLALDATRLPGRDAAALLGPARPANWPMPAVAERAGAGQADNFGSAPFAQQSAIDLAVQNLRYLAQCVNGGGEGTVTWGVYNLSRQTVRNVPVVLRSNGKSIWNTVVPELKPGQFERLSVDLTMRCEAEYRTEVEVNPDRSIDERGQYANNSLEQTIWVAAEDEHSGGDRPVLTQP
jgi:hypothetical protein